LVVGGVIDDHANRSRMVEVLIACIGSVMIAVGVGATLFVSRDWPWLEGPDPGTFTTAAVGGGTALVVTLAIGLSLPNQGAEVVGVLWLWPVYCLVIAVPATLVARRRSRRDQDP
jgi:nitrate/nitrite transporter NarK